MTEACLYGNRLILLRIFQSILQYVCKSRLVQPFEDGSLDAIRIFL